MADEKDTKTVAMGAIVSSKATPGKLTKKNEETMSAEAMFDELGFDPDDIKGFQQTAAGGATKWVNMKGFMEDPEIPDNKPCAGNGKAFAGTLVGKGMMEVSEDESGEEVVDAQTGEVKKVRYFYGFRLAAPCPVTFQDDEGNDCAEVANPGDIVYVGERFQFRKWREMADNGGEYLVIVQPDSRRKIRKGKRTMWTFNIWEKAVRLPPPRSAALLPAAPTK